METTQGKGIRTMAAYMDPTTAFYASPINDMVLRMFEELGMPILHYGACTNCSISYYWESIPTEDYFVGCNDAIEESCNNDPLYPVDVWLYDHRIRALVESDDFRVAFPDKAILAKQFVEWPIGGRKITPRHGIEILTDVGPKVAGFDRLHPETDCLEFDATLTEFRKSGPGIKGAGAGEYVCFNRDYHNGEYFQTCPGESTTTTSPTKVPTTTTLVTKVPTRAPVAAPTNAPSADETSGGANAFCLHVVTLMVGFIAAFLFV